MKNPDKIEAPRLPQCATGAMRAKPREVKVGGPWRKPIVRSQLMRRQLGEGFQIA